MENNKTNNTNENYEKVLDLIQSIQTKMNQKENNENKDTKDSNVEIDNNNNNKEVNNKNINLDNTNNTDFSAITDILKNVDIGNLINTFSNNNNNNNNKNDSNSFDFSNFDPKLFGRIQKIITTMNTNDPKRNLLISLKPFLRKSRQDKLNEYITILGIIKVLGIFDKKGSDDNV